jgi:membrane associated rhomboid family serine protease
MKKQSSAVISIITVCSAFYLLQLISPNLVTYLQLESFSNLQRSHEWYRLFTVALMHDTSSSIPFHLGLNMINLYLIGGPVEQVAGRFRFYVIFFGSLLLASLGSALLMSDSSASIGASGAVYGILGAFAVMGRRTSGEFRSIAMLVLITLVVGFTIPGIDWHAHIAGLFAGAAITKLVLRFNVS